MRYMYRGKQRGTCRRVQMQPTMGGAKSKSGPCTSPAQRSPASQPGVENLLLTPAVKSNNGLSRLSSPSHFPRGEDTCTEDSGYSSHLLLPSLCSPAEDYIGEDPVVVSTPDSRPRNRETRGQLSPADHEPRSVRECDSSVAPIPKKGPWHLLPALAVGRAVCRSVISSRGKLGIDQTLLENALLGQNLSVDNLIGRKMALDQVDIFHELSQRDFKHVLWKVLRFLNEDDLLNCSKVSKLWKMVVMDAKKAGQITIKSSRRRKGSGVEYSCDVGLRRSWARRGALLTVQPVAGVTSEKLAPSLRSPARLSETPVVSLRRERCREVVRTLKWDEAVRNCPQCGLAARYLPHQQRGTCNSRTCGFDFCQRCFGKFHGSSDCLFKPLGSSARVQPLPGSRGSKYNLRRL